MIKYTLFHFDKFTIDNTIEINPAHIMTKRRMKYKEDEEYTEIQLVTGLIYRVVLQCDGD